MYWRLNESTTIDLGHSTAAFKMTHRRNQRKASSATAIRLELDAERLLRDCFRVRCVEQQALQFESNHKSSKRSQSFADIL